MKRSLSNAAFLIPKKRFIASNISRQDTIKVEGRITNVIFPRDINNYEGWAIVVIGGYTVGGMFPFLDLFFEYRIKCARDTKPQQGRVAYKLIKFLDPPYRPISINTVELWKMMIKTLSFSNDKSNDKIRHIRRYLEEQDKDDKDLDARWLLENYKKKWISKLEDRSFVFRYEQVVDLSNIWSHGTLRRMKLTELEAVVAQMKKDPCVFCFHWKHPFNLPELNVLKLIRCGKIFGVHIDNKTISAISSVRQNIYKFRRQTGAISYTPGLVVGENIDQQYCIKNDILLPKYIHPLEDVRWFLVGDYIYMIKCSEILRKIFHYSTRGLVKRTMNAKRPIKKKLPDGETIELKMTPEQERVFDLVDKYNLLVILGSAGTGKTLLGQFIHRSFKRGTVLPLAYYGRIASKLQKDYKSGMTIHRMKTEIANGTKRGQYIEENTRVVIIDEVSIVTIDLLFDVLTSLPNLCKIIMLGDDEQMPPPSPGNILKAFINKYDNTEVINRLTKIMRVDPEMEVLLDNFSKLRKGRADLNYSKDVNSNHPFVVLNRSHIPPNLENVQRTEERVAIMMKDLQPVVKKYPNSDDIQIMTQKNSVRQDIVRAVFEIKKHDEDTQFKKGTFHVGEKIMFLVNDYGTRGGKPHLRSDVVMNGEIVTIESIFDVDPETETPDDSSARVRLRSTADIKRNSGWDRIIYLEDGRQINLTYYPISSIDKGSAATVASCQGSEYLIAILYIHARFSNTLKKEELYTAVTRAKKRVIVICDSGSENDVTPPDIARIVSNPYVHPEYIFAYWLPDLMVSEIMW